LPTKGKFAVSDLLVQNCDVLQIAKDGAQVEVLRGQDILVHGNKIGVIQSAGQAEPSHFRQVVDARGMLAMPGLINNHAHVPMVLFRGLAEDVPIDRWFNDYIWPMESNLQEDDVYWGMMLGLVEMIEGGVTSVADHYFHMDRVAQAVDQIGTRALLAWGIFGSQGEEAVRMTADFVRKHHGTANGRIRAWMGPHAPYTCDDDFLRACVKAAQELGVGIHTHVAETMQQTRTSVERRGLTPIQVIEQVGILEPPTILAHVKGATPEDIEILRRYPTGIAHAPKTYMKLASGIAPIVEFRQAGIPVGLATDGAASNSTLDLWESLRLMALVQKSAKGSAEVLPISEALYIATRESARVFGLPDELGAIEPGYLADIILVDLSGVHHQPLHNVGASLVYNTRASDVQTVIVDGKVVMRDRQLLTINKAEVIDNVRVSMERLAQRLPEKRIQEYNT
jgi:5-methylthioadenosine/S-adenosylhomocysteine deaminase